MFNYFFCNSVFPGFAAVDLQPSVKCQEVGLWRQLFSIEKKKSFASLSSPPPHHPPPPPLFPPPPPIEQVHPTVHPVAWGWGAEGDMTILAMERFWFIAEV